MKQLTEFSFIDKLKSLPFVEAIYLFGSRARGDAHERSDIDLAIVCPSADIKDWLQVIDIVDEADTLLKIDCIRLDRLSDERLKAEIERDKVTLYARK